MTRADMVPPTPRVYESPRPMPRIGQLSRSRLLSHQLGARLMAHRNLTHRQQTSQLRSWTWIRQMKLIFMVRPAQDQRLSKLAPQRTTRADIVPPTPRLYESRMPMRRIGQLSHSRLFSHQLGARLMAHQNLTHGQQTSLLVPHLKLRLVPMVPPTPRLYESPSPRIRLGRNPMVYQSLRPRLPAAIRWMRTH